MFVATTTYLLPLPPEHPLIPGHRDHLDREYAAGNLVCSGPQVPRVGGIVVIRGQDEDAAHDLMRRDPLVSEGLVSYTLVQFTAVKALSVELVE